ncbi:unnamed protein product [Onchocerca flexuosa]|nr:unnamed protein product [Onchocerca flexuosa]
MAISKDATSDEDELQPIYSYSSGMFDYFDPTTQSFNDKRGEKEVETKASKFAIFHIVDDLSLSDCQICHCQFSYGVNLKMKR